MTTHWQVSEPPIRPRTEDIPVPPPRVAIRADAVFTGIGVMLLVCLCTLASPLKETWPVGIFESGVLCLTAFWLQRCVWTGRRIGVGRSFFLTALIPVIGLVQLIAGISVYGNATRQAILYWSAISCLVLLTNSLCIERVFRHCFLFTLIVLALALALANMTELVSSAGFQTAFQTSGWRSLGLLISSNQYAELMELALPICLARAVFDRKRWLVYGLVSAVLYGTVIGCRSRMGAGVATLELIALLVTARLWPLVPVGHVKRVVAMMSILPLGMALAVGVGGLYHRLRDPNPLAGRSEIFTSTVQAISKKPVTGYGLGTFSTIYPEFAVRDLGGVVTHAHDEWLEAVSDGGIPLLIVFVLIFARLIRPAVRSLWGLGVVAILLHGAVDFPLQRMSICAWTFVLVGALEAGYFSKLTGSPESVSPDSVQNPLRSRRPR